MPHITQTFSVDRPIQTVWDFFQDVPAVATCMPGVEGLDSVGENAYKGRMSIKLGPINAKFDGQAKIENLDETRHSGAITAKAADRQGGSRASAQVTYSLTPEGAVTKVDIVADITLQGAMAQFGRTGLIQEVSSQLTKEFASCIEQKLAAPSIEEAAGIQASEVRGLQVFWQGFRGWLKNLFRRKRNS